VLLPSLGLYVLQELSPTFGMKMRISDLLGAEEVHALHVILDFLSLKSWDSDLSKIDNEVVSNHIIVLNVSLTLRDGLEDGLSLRCFS
jgi:hypothetical protein